MHTSITTILILSEMLRIRGPHTFLITLLAFGLLARSAGGMCEHVPSSLTITSLAITQNCTPLYAGSIADAVWVTEPQCGQLDYILGLQLLKPPIKTPLRAGLPTTGIAEDFSVWFIDAGNRMIYRISNGPVELSFALRPQGNPVSVTVDRSGRPWIAMAQPSVLARLTTAGFLEYACVPSSSAPSMISAGNSGEIYFTERDGIKLGRLSKDDTFSELSLVADGSVVWQRVGRLSWEGNSNDCKGPVEETDAQAILAATLSDPPSRLIVDGLGNIWMTQSACRGKRCGAIVEASSTGTVHHYYIPTTNSKPADLDIGCDDAIWFTEFAGGKIGRLSRDGRMKEYRLPRGSAPFGIAFGRLWILYYTEPTKDRVNYSTSTAIKGQVVPQTRVL